MMQKAKGIWGWCAGALCLALAGPAQAESYDVIELGITYNREDCMRRGENILYQYRNRHGGGNVARSNWVIYGWDMRPGDQDVVVMCPVVSGTVDAFLVVHSEGTESNRIFTVEELRWLWNQ